MVRVFGKERKKYLDKRADFGIVSFLSVWISKQSSTVELHPSIHQPTQPSIRYVLCTYCMSGSTADLRDVHLNLHQPLPSRSSLSSGEVKDICR